MLFLKIRIENQTLSTTPPNILLFTAIKIRKLQVYKTYVFSREKEIYEKRMNTNV